MDSPLVARKESSAVEGDDASDGKQARKHASMEVALDLQYHGPCAKLHLFTLDLADRQMFLCRGNTAGEPQCRAWHVRRRKRISSPTTQRTSMDLLA